MKDMIQKLFGWMKVSNRPLHAYCGFAAFMAMLIIQASMMSIVEGTCPTIPVVALQRLMVLFVLTAVLVTLLLMCTVEFIQQRGGGKWDWLDIAAGMIPAVGTAVFVILVILLT